LGALQFLTDFFRQRRLNVWKAFLHKGAAWQSLVLQSVGEMRPEEIDEAAREAFRELATTAPPNLRATAVALLKNPALRAAVDPSFDLLTAILRSDPRAEVRATAQNVLLERWRYLPDDGWDGLAQALFDRSKEIRRKSLELRRTEEDRPD